MGRLTRRPPRHDPGGLAQLVTEPLERFPRRPVGHLDVDLHRERDLAMPENRHGDARVHVERGQPRAACPARVVDGDPPDSCALTAVLEAPVETARLDRAAVRVVNISVCGSPQMHLSGHASVWAWFRRSPASQVRVNRVCR